MPSRKIRDWVRHKVLGQLNSGLGTGERSLADAEESDAISEEAIRTELKRLQGLVEDRKQTARDTDVSYHLWALYKDHFQGKGPQAMQGTVQNGEWYDITTLGMSSRDGLNEIEFELKGSRYRFVDDEEKQGWRENLKFFSLFLYDDSDRCLIEIPIKMRVDNTGRDYAILSDGPRAFLPGGWANDFISVALKHQSIRNQEIRVKKHQDRLREIEDLKKRFGIAD